LPDRVDAGRVEAGQRLVEDEEVRVVHEGGGQLDTLLVAEGERLDLAPRAVGDPEPLQPAGRGRGGGRRGQPVQAAEVLKLLADEHARVEAALLRQVAEPAAIGVGDRGAVPADGARGQGGEPEHGAHRGGLARAVRAEESGHLT
jgi:hypothetical protein